MDEDWYYTAKAVLDREPHLEWFRSEDMCSAASNFSFSFDASDQAENMLARGVTVRRRGTPHIDGLHIPPRFLTYNAQHNEIRGYVEFVTIGGTRYGQDGRTWVRCEEPQPSAQESEP